MQRRFLRHRDDRTYALHGWGIDAQRMQSGVDALLGNKTLVPQGGVLTVFKLGK